MRFRGQEYTGAGITIAIIDSGVNIEDPRLIGAQIEGWRLDLGADRHAVMNLDDFNDEHGHGTEIAACVHHMAPDAKLVAIKIMGKKLRTSAELMAAGIESASLTGAQIINLSLGTPNMGKAAFLRDCCAQAVERGSIVIAAAHPKRNVAYPADLPEAVGVGSHPDCPMDKTFFLDPQRFSRKGWGTLSGKFLTHGYALTRESKQGRYRGSGVATAYLSGNMACLRQAMPQRPISNLVDHLKLRALTPMPEIGYS